MLDNPTLMNLEYLSIVELNERGRAVSLWADGFRRIRPSRQGIGGGWCQRGRYLLEELTVVPFGPAIDGGIREISTSYPRFLSRDHIRGRNNVHRWLDKGSWRNHRSRCTRPGLGRR